MDRIGENGVNKEPRRQVGKLGHGSYERRCGENVWLARTSTTTVRLHGMESQNGLHRMGFSECDVCPKLTEPDSSWPTTSCLPCSRHQGETAVGKSTRGKARLSRLV